MMLHRILRRFLKFSMFREILSIPGIPGLQHTMILWRHTHHYEYMNMHHAVKMHLPIVGTNFALSSVVCSCHKKQQQTNKPLTYNST